MAIVAALVDLADGSAGFIVVVAFGGIDNLQRRLLQPIAESAIVTVIAIFVIIFASIGLLCAPLSLIPFFTDLGQEQDPVHAALYGNPALKAWTIGSTAVGMLLSLINLIAAIQALYGATEYLSHHQHIFGYSKKHYLDSATGTFINRNHFAAYLAMGLPFALGPLIGGRVSLFGGGTWRERFVRLSDSSNLLALLCGSAAVVNPTSAPPRALERTHAEIADALHT